MVHERVGQENLPAKNIFSLTSLGEEVFRGWVSEPVNHVRDMRLEFPTKLWFVSQTDPAEAKKLIENQLAACREKADVLTKFGNSCPTEIEALSADLKLKVVEAAISWLEGLRKVVGPRPLSVPDCVREREKRG